MKHVGNSEILIFHKTAFLCSQRYPSSIVLPSYDWAQKQREQGSCVIIGSHSPIEKDVFHFLLKGQQPLILALARGLSQRIDPEIKKAIDSGRLLLVSPFDNKIKRVTRETAEIRNRFMVDIADEIMVGYVSEGGQLSKILAFATNKPIQYIGIAVFEHS
jgi:hypothetical protein